MEIGALIGLHKGDDILKRMTELRDMELQSCQINVWDTSLYTKEIADEVNEASRKTGIRVSTLWAGWSGPAVWNFIHGPQTLGLVPAAYRGIRLQDLLAAIPFAKWIGVKNIATHAGFMPENPSDPDYVGTIGTLQYLCNKMKEEDIYFLFETGQETPVTLLRAIEDIGTGNVGINLDTANLILYGKGNPVDGLRVFGKYVRDLHIKDGLFPTNGRQLGHETAVGEGMANFPEVFRLLKEANYAGPYTIEREISGPQQSADIIRARDLVRSLVKE